MMMIRQGEIDQTPTSNFAKFSHYGSELTAEDLVITPYNSNFAPTNTNYIQAIRSHNGGTISLPDQKERNSQTKAQTSCM